MPHTIDNKVNAILYVSVRILLLKRTGLYIPTSVMAKVRWIAHLILVTIKPYPATMIWNTAIMIAIIVAIRLYAAESMIHPDGMQNLLSL